MYYRGYFQLFIPKDNAKTNVNIRRQGEISYATLSLSNESPLVFIGKVDADFHRNNNIEFYISTTDDSSKEKFLVGNPVKPLVVFAPKQKDDTANAKKDFIPMNLGFLHNPPAAAVLYKTIPITVFAPEPMKNPKMRYRAKGKVAYKEVELTAKPNSFYYFKILEDEVVEPAIQYYLTVASPEGKEVLVVGNPENPQSIPVAGFVINPAIELQKYKGNRNKLQFTIERVGFFKKDFYTHYEADYLYRIFTTLYSIRRGMGIFQGEGFGGLAYKNPQRNDYYYGYTEGEFRVPGGGFSLIGRFLTGINGNGIGTGFETKIRLGDEFGVNLLNSLWTASQLGTSGSIQLNVPVNDRWGFSSMIAVEDLPVKGETGFRLAVDAHRLIAEDLEINGRIGMAARTTTRVGANIGIGIIRHF